MESKHRLQLGVSFDNGLSVTVTLESMSGVEKLPNLMRSARTCTCTPLLDVSMFQHRGVDGSTAKRILTLLPCLLGLVTLTCEELTQ